ncbi:anti-sigma factor [Rhodocytophaga rosea]|uniref:Anti-sigma factor n=1 Tax=Rhodocytophaga rosea TaxID=2704465 RepID=A0A6C0GPZ4_9BACT|nr:anti-sigma factor [Rhodocytophaga rosea]QHT70138.1 anti-sigma factor [Rhodocytophaga rosea]
MESYVLGIVSAEESAEIEALAHQYPQIKAEIEAIRASLEAYIMQHEEMPPAALKKKIWHKLEELEEDKANIIPASVITQPVTGRTAEVKPLGGWKRYLVAASLAGLIISVGANIFLYGQLQNTRQQLTEANTANSRLAQELEVNKANYSRATDELAIFSDPDNKVVYLKGLKPAPDATVVVYWNSQQKQVHLAVHNLPAHAADKQYQLWAIVGGKPVDAGMLDMNNPQQSLQKMKEIEKAEAFAITLEKKGGNPTPQGDMYVLGEV